MGEKIESRKGILVSSVCAELELGKCHGIYNVGDGMTFSLTRGICIRRGKNLPWRTEPGCEGLAQHGKGLERWCSHQSFSA